jgi:ribosomal protein S12 methylthiotransferase accessory factor YcaO
MPALAALRGAPYVDDVSVFGQALHVRLKDVPPEPLGADDFAAFAASAQRAVVMDILRKHLLAANIEVRAVRSVYPSLEDIFVSFTRRMDREAGLP